MNRRKPPTGRPGLLLGLCLLASQALACGGSCPIIPGGGPCVEPEPDTGSIDDPFLAGTAITFVPSGIATVVGGLSTFKDLEVPRGFHIFGALSGATTIALATGSVIRNHDKGPRHYLPAPIIAALTGVPALTFSIIGLLAPSETKPPPVGALHCSQKDCQLGIPLPIVLRDQDGSPSPGLRLLQGRF